MRGFVDTRPLRDFLREHLTGGSGALTGIAENLEQYFRKRILKNDLNLN